MGLCLYPKPHFCCQSNFPKSPATVYPLPTAAAFSSGLASSEKRYQRAVSKHITEPHGASHLTGLTSFNLPNNLRLTQQGETEGQKH